MKPAARYEFFKRLQAIDAHPGTELKYSTTFELLIAVILSAQATDISVNKATKDGGMSMDWLSVLRSS